MKVIVVLSIFAIASFLLGLIFKKVSATKQTYNGSTTGIIEDCITENTSYWHHVGYYIDGKYYRGQTIYYNPPHKYEKGDQVPIKYYGNNNEHVVIDDEELITLDKSVKNAARNMWIVSGMLIGVVIIYAIVLQFK